MNSSSKQSERYSTLKYFGVFLFLGIGILLLLFACNNTPPSNYSNPQELDNASPVETLQTGEFYRITDCNNDAEQVASTGVNRTSKVLDLGNQPYVGLRFENVDIPSGTIINNAYVQFMAKETHSTTSNLDIWAEQSSDAVTFSGANNNLSSRRTSGSETVNWITNSWTKDEADEDQRTPNLAAVIQEVIDISGWSSGNSLALVLEDEDADGNTDGNGTAGNVAISCDNDPAEADLEAPFLYVEYDTPAPNTTLVDERIDDGLDDAYETETGGVNRSGLGFKLGEKPYVGLRFDFLDGDDVNSNSDTIPQGATITNAYIEFTARSSSSSSTKVVITAEDSNNAPALSGSSNDLSSRTETTAKVVWDIDEIWATDTKYQTPNIAPVIQKVVHRSGWSGDGLLLFIESEELGTGNSPIPTHQAWSYDGGGSSKAPRLVVEYNQPPKIIDFTVNGDTSVSIPDNQSITFDWEVSSPKSQTLTCSVDVDNDGNAEHNATCSGTHSYTYSIPETGLNRAKLTVTDQDSLVSEAVVDTYVFGSNTSFNVAITDSHDDVEESASSGGVRRLRNTLELGNTSYPYVGLRFLNVNIPKQSTITNAYVQFVADASSGGTNVDLDIWAHASDNAPQFAGGVPNNLSSRTPTSAVVSWSVGSWTAGHSGSAQQTEDLTEVIQEVISRPGWSSGNALALIIKHEGASNLREAVSYDGNSSEAPKLYVEYIDADDTINIAAAGDIACNINDPNYNSGNGTTEACHMRAVGSTIKNVIQPDAVLPLGDIVYDVPTGEPIELISYNLSYGHENSWGSFKDITFPALGNHGYSNESVTARIRTNTAEAYFDYFGDRAYPPYVDKNINPYITIGSSEYNTEGHGYYSYNLGDWHMIALNSQCSGATRDGEGVGGCGVLGIGDSPQLAWLKQDLINNPSTCTLAYFHHPLFTSGKKYRDDKLGKYEFFWKELYKAGVDVVVVGHDHIYERFAPQGDVINDFDGPDHDIDNRDLEGKGYVDRGVADPTGMVQLLVGTGGKGADLIVENPRIDNSVEAIEDTFGVLELTLHKSSYDWAFVDENGGRHDEGHSSCYTGSSRTYP